MLPWGHLFVAALPVVAYVLVRDRRLPTPKLLYVVFVGSQFPDLVDKPLAHQFLLIPNGRMFAHSLVVAVPLCLVVTLAVRRSGHLREGVTFAFAYLSHIVADYRHLLLRPDPRLDSNMLWPLVPARPGRLEPYWAGPNSINVKLWTVFSVAVLSLTAYLAWRELRQSARDGDATGERG